MDFSKFSGVSSSNERKNPVSTKKQEYEGLKYRKFVPKGKTDAEGRFYVSNKVWDQFNLDANGLKQFTNKETGETVIAVVSDDDAIILKKSKKGEKTTSFKSTRLEAALHRIAVIDSSLVDMNQFINVASVAQGVAIGDVNCLYVLTPTKGEVKAKNAAPGHQGEAKAPKAVNEPTANVAAAPVAEEDWN
jgi:hypothetical protein